MEHDLSVQNDSLVCIIITDQKRLDDRMRQHTKKKTAHHNTTTTNQQQQQFRLKQWVCFCVMFRAQKAGEASV